MSLVGTRPPTVDEYEQYELGHRKRLAMKPGLTGMWQVSGRGDITDFDEVVALDAKYIEQWNITMDKASTFVYLNEALYDYRIGSGMTAKFDENYFFTFKHIFEQIEKEKADWKLKDFDKLFSIKVLQTAGRAITQVI